MTTDTKKTERYTGKATHVGHCQVCGSAQKLPRGLLSKHGYTTRWGFFSGTCYGAGELPFELDKGLIDDAIVRAEVQAEELRAEADAVRAQADPNSCWYHAYFNENFRGGSGYRWVKTCIARPLVVPFPQLSYWHPGDGRPARWEQAGYYGLDGAVGAARDSNGHYANHLEKKARQIDGYVAWQRARIQDWAPQPLTPVK